MDLAAELAARDKKVTISIGVKAAYVELYSPGRKYYSKSKIPMSPAIFDIIEGEIERLLEGVESDAVH